VNEGGQGGKLQKGQRENHLNSSGCSRLQIKNIIQGKKKKGGKSRERSHYTQAVRITKEKEGRGGKRMDLRRISQLKREKIGLLRGTGV